MIRNDRWNRPGAIWPPLTPRTSTDREAGSGAGRASNLAEPAAETNPWARLERPRRRLTPPVSVGSVTIGGGSPVAVQSMTNTETADVEATARQVVALARAGSEIVRITVNSEEAARAVPQIVRRVRAEGIQVPIVGDFHYNGHLLLTRFPASAEALDKYRINPGNVGTKHRDDNFAQIIRVARDQNKPIRIGVNWGSLDQQLLTSLMEDNARRERPWSSRAVTLEAMVQSALRSARLAEELGLPHNRIILSAKVSAAPDLVAVYRRLAQLSDYPLHLGLTEAGMGMPGIVASAAALAPLLLEGIGDTIRVSITPAPGGDRCEEVRVAQQILQALGLRAFSPQVTACPGCGRTTNRFFQEMARDIQAYLEEHLPAWRERYPGVEELKVAVMGCVVNGPGESRHADIGISLPGAFEEPKAPVYVDGRLRTTLQGEEIVPRFIEILNEYVEGRFGPGSRSAGTP